MRGRLGLQVLAAIVLAACGGDEPAEPCVDLTGQATFTISMLDNSFDPACAIADRSQGLTLVNEGDLPHTFTIEGTQVDVEVAAGETANLEAIRGAIAAGSHEVVCTIHPEMTMELRAR